MIDAKAAEKVGKVAADYQNPGLPVSFRKFTRIYMIGIPLLFFFGGCHCLYDAFWLFRERQ